MKRRIEGASFSTSKAKKKRAWEEDEDDVEDEKPEEKPEKPKAPPPPPGVDDDLWEALEEQAKEEDKEPASGDEDKDPAEPTVKSETNPVVWLQITVAGRPRGKIFFELFRDVVPRTVENFRKLIVGVELEGQAVGYKGTELHKVVPGKLIEGGDFDRSASGQEFIDESCRLKHAKAGLLSMKNRGPNTNSSRFQVCLSPRPELDGKQVVFGQLVTDPSGEAAGLHPLHWVEAMGSSSGDPREAVIVEDCGECGAVPAESSESQEARYARAGIRHGKLEDSIESSNVEQVLELTQDVLDDLEWQCKKVNRTEDGRERSQRSVQVESSLKSLRGVLEMAEHKAGEVQGFENKTGRTAKAQLIQVKDLEEQLTKLV